MSILFYTLTSSGPESLSDESDDAADFFFGMISTMSFPTDKNNNNNKNLTIENYPLIFFKFEQLTFKFIRK